MTTSEPTTIEGDELGFEQFVELLNEDLKSEYQSIVQYTVHVATITGAEYLAISNELAVHLTQELEHARVLAEQVAFLGGIPASTVNQVASTDSSIAALEADLELETSQLERYRVRFSQAEHLGLGDVSEALRPLLEQTQDHVRDLRSALGK